MKKMNQTNEMTAKEVFKTILATVYKPADEGGEDIVYKSTLEVYYEFKSTCDLQLHEVTAAMLELGFKGSVIAGDYLWSLAPTID